MSEGCVFCRIVAGDAPATMVVMRDDAVAFVPLSPVTPGHLLVVPTVHVVDFTQDPQVSAATMSLAAWIAGDLMREQLWPCNLITSAGRAASQTVMHLHLHLVPRRRGDGLALPWTAGVAVVAG